MTHDMDLDEIGVLEGTNKSSLRMDYLRYYKHLLAPYREKEINLLELGVQNGASLRMWQQHFPRARIIGVDVNERASRYSGANCFVYIGSQADSEFLQGVVETHPPTIIIDDASHRADFTIVSLETLFPHLEAGGCYIVEDLYLHFGAGADHWRGDAVESPVSYFQTLLHDLLSRSVNGLPPPRSSIVDLVDRFMVIPGAIALWRRSPEEDMSERLERLKSTVARSNIAVNWYYLAIFLMKNGGPPAEAENAARTAVTLDPSARSYRALSQALKQRGDIAGAIEAMEAAFAVATQPHEKSVITKQLNGLQRRGGSKEP